MPLGAAQTITNMVDQLKRIEKSNIAYESMSHIANVGLY